MIDKVEKLLWMYMIEHGSVGATWSHYGGRYEGDEEWDENYDPNKNTALLKDVKHYGVDWKKTSSVREEARSAFNGTFDEPDNISVLEGTLVLNNKKKYNVGTTAKTPDILKAMSHYIIDCFEDMK